MGTTIKENICRGALMAALFFQSSFAASATIKLICIGTKSVESVSGKNFKVQNFHQVYIFQDGKLQGNSPEPIDENTIGFKLSRDDDLNCKNFCAHSVVFNNRTSEVFDENYSIENKVKHYWKFKGNCTIG